MHWYKQEDMVIANAVIPSIHKHLWYLTEQLVVFALFNESLSNFTRGLMDKKLFSIPRPTSNQLGKPKFSAIEISGSTTPFLHDLIGPNSWLLFSLIKLNNSQEWLQLPPEYWNLMSDYRTTRDFVKQLEVTNDCAERGIKLIGDYKDYTQDEEQRQYILQVV